MNLEEETLRDKAWWQARKYSAEKLVLALQALEDIRSGQEVFEAIRRHPLPNGEGYLGKHNLVAAYRQQVDSGVWEPDPGLLARIRMKPMRTLSGVTTVTVLTEHYPCPGKCIFCPDDVRMPKSYLPDEPGAMRGLFHKFDPYDQVVARLDALYAVGHPIDKIELLILGGTWSAYPRDYQAWFVQRCLEAMNGTASETLDEAQSVNEKTQHRNVGLVVETRPDHVDANELAWMRKLGVTKVQMGAQSLDDQILKLNKRGHSYADTRRAVALLRAGGFKIVLHWMPNLLGATVHSDREDFSRLWDGLAPDEIKIYPTQLLVDTELHKHWQRKEYIPYSTQELIDLIADVKSTIPRYCRVNRIIRDIPSTNVVAGNKRSSLRQDVQRELKNRGLQCQCVRCREVRGKLVEVENLRFDDLVYETDSTREHFLTYVTDDDRLTSFLRLALPLTCAPETGLHDLADAAIIREVHVYGQSLGVGEEKHGAAQHVGIGTDLVMHAERIAQVQGYRRLAVISAIGTRQYYRKRGFERGDLYMIKDLSTAD